MLLLESSALQGLKNRSPKCKGFTKEDVNIGKSLVRLYKIEADEDRTRIEMRGVQLEESGCTKIS